MSSREGNHLDDLLLEWEERRERGESVLPEELCAAVPHLIHELVRRIRLLEAGDRLLAIPHPPTPQPHAPVPTTVAGYEVMGVLGRGGMGVVYKARDPLLCRVVAVKTVRAVASGGADLHLLSQRFRLEGQVLARLRHEAIVPIYEARVQDGDLCLVMEYEPGGTLADRRARYAAEGPAAVLPLMERVARAIAYVHRQGVLHRDLKPANLLFGADEQVRVSDFGLAKLMSEPLPGPELAASTHAANETSGGPAGGAHLTAPWVHPGTRAYMAPEQYDPTRFGPVGPATDVWALGVILHELLAGSRPFSGRSWGEWQTHVCDGAVPRVPGLGRRLQRVVDRCLAKDPNCRFRTADQLADALKAVEPRSRWWLAGVAVAVAVAVVGGFALAPRSQPAAAVWPDLPAVREAHAQLARGESVELIGPEKPPSSFEWATGEGSGRRLSHDQLFRVTSGSPVGGLVELLPALPPGRYRIDAELFHEMGNGSSWVGIYAAASHCQIARGRQHFLLLVRYSDRGSEAEESAAKNSTTANRRTHLRTQYMGEAQDSPVAAVAETAPHPRNRLVPAPPTGWRSVSLTIDARGATAAQADQPVGQVTVEQMEQYLARVRRKYPDLPDDGWAVRADGGIGLLVFNGSLAVRSFRVTPLPPGE